VRWRRNVHWTSTTPAASISASAAPRRLKGVNWGESSPLASVLIRPLDKVDSVDMVVDEPRVCDATQCVNDAVRFQRERDRPRQAQHVPTGSGRHRGFAARASRCRHGASATAGIFKSVKKARRHAKRDAVAAADEAVIAATATGAPGRIDDETQGLPLVSTAIALPQGRCFGSRACYMCKNHYTLVDAFYHQLCPSAPHSATPSATLAPTSPVGAPCLPVAAPRSACTLRCDCSATAPTRLSPPASERRRTPLQCDARQCRLAAPAAHRGHRPARPSSGRRARGHRGRAGPAGHPDQQRCADGAPSRWLYAALIEAERTPAAELVSELVEVITFDRVSDAHPAALAGSLAEHHTPHAVTELALAARSASPDRIAAGTAIDAGGLLPDTASINSWTQPCTRSTRWNCSRFSCGNQTAPFILVSRLRPAMAASPSRRKYVVNVSAMRDSSAVCTRVAGIRTPTWRRLH